MKILFLASDIYIIGGVQVYNQHLHRALERSGQTVELMIMKRSTLLCKLIYALRVTFKAFRWKPDFVICAHITFSPLALFLNLLFRTPYTVSLYGVEVPARKTWLQRLALTSAFRVVFIFQWAMRIFRENFPKFQNKLFFLPSPVDGNRFVLKEKSARLQEKLELSGCPVILTVARLERCKRNHKGCERVLKSLPRVVAEIPSVKYILVGDGDDAGYMRSLVENLHLSKNVLMVGAVAHDDIVDYFNLADVFVMPSRDEGFGIVFIEALACGKPVIAGQYSRDELLNGDLGITVEAEDIEGISENIIKILKRKTNPALLDPHGLRKRVLELYGSDTFQQRVKNLVDMIPSAN